MDIQYITNAISSNADWNQTAFSQFEELQAGGILAIMLKLSVIKNQMKAVCLATLCISFFFCFSVQACDAPLPFPSDMRSESELRALWETKVASEYALANTVVSAVVIKVDIIKENDNSLGTIPAKAYLSPLEIFKGKSADAQHIIFSTANPLCGSNSREMRFKERFNAGERVLIFSKKNSISVGVDLSQPAEPVVVYIYNKNIKAASAQNAAPPNNYPEIAMKVVKRLSDAERPWWKFW